MNSVNLDHKVLKFTMQLLVQKDGSMINKILRGTQLTAKDTH